MSRIKVALSGTDEDWAWIDGIARRLEAEGSAHGRGGGNTAIRAIIAAARDLEPPSGDEHQKTTQRMPRLDEELIAEIERWPGHTRAEKFRALLRAVRESGVF